MNRLLALAAIASTCSVVVGEEETPYVGTASTKRSEDSSDSAACGWYPLATRERLWPLIDDDWWWRVWTPTEWRQNLEKLRDAIEEDLHNLYYECTEEARKGLRDRLGEGLHFLKVIAEWEAALGQEELQEAIKILEEIAKARLDFVKRVVELGLGIMKNAKIKRDLEEALGKGIEILKGLVGFNLDLLKDALKGAKKIIQQVELESWRELDGGLAKEGLGLLEKAVKDGINLYKDAIKEALQFLEEHIVQRRRESRDQLERDTDGKENDVEGLPS